ncbi:hypothetical protein D3C76_530710 [compost metagenome]|uniref:DUF1097 domain-containing protein n=1 Tax=Paenibacillus sp. FSL R7-0216 TaxID=2921677 RepID=UPI000FC02B8C
MKLTKLDFSVAILAGLTCLTMYFDLPVWALFIGWAWYFALGAKPGAFKEAIPAMLLGYILAAVAVVVYAASGHQMIALVLVVAVTVFLIMLSLKTSVFSCSLASFNAYSCMFAGYYAGNFPKVESISLDLNNVLICVLWLVLANVIGLLCGYISVTVGNLGNKNK